MAPVSKIFIIAGPQSSGKTTAWNMWKSLHPEWCYLEEMNPYLLLGKNHPGGAYMSADLERRITRKDKELTSSLERRGKVYVMETGIFHLVYMERYCGKKAAEHFFPHYLKAHEGLAVRIIFIDTKPHISWQRRKEVYEKRLDDAGIMEPAKREAALRKYREFINGLYPLWLKYYKLLPFDKSVIRNSYRNFEGFKEYVAQSCSL